MLAKRKVTVGLLIILAVLLKIKKDKFGPNVSLAWLVKRAIGYVLGQVMPIPSPRVVAGAGSIAQIGVTIRKLGCKKALIVSDATLVKAGLVKKCQDSLDAAGVKHEVFDNVFPNPQVESIEEGFAKYKAGGCDGIVAVGGGSPMDVAKVIGAKAANPKDVRAYKGYFQVNRLMLKPLPPFVAVPTTAGTGSEATMGAVVTVKETNTKLIIVDLGLVPQVAVLDPEVLVGLPKHITAATGMDALTHAIEAYLSGWASAASRPHSLEAVGKIFRNLESSYTDGTNLAAREAMLTAALSAGLAINRANVGYVHAIAHQFGGIFHTPHGDANAMLLPHVLQWFIDGEKEGEAAGCVGRFCELAVTGGLAQSVPSSFAAQSSTWLWAAQVSLAQQLVDRIRAMNVAMNMPTEIKDMKASQVTEITNRALLEAHGSACSPFTQPLSWALDLGYPVPKYMAFADCESIVAACLPGAEKKVWDCQRPANGQGPARS